MPQRRGRCERATLPDRNLSRLHHCFVFQINWPLKIALRPSQHYWCTFSSPQLKVCKPHAALSPRSRRLLAPLVTENKLGLHIRAEHDCRGKEQLKAGGGTQCIILNMWLSLIALTGWGCLYCAFSCCTYKKTIQLSPKKPKKPLFLCALVLCYSQNY